jgi:WD40 repeat protein
LEFIGKGEEVLSSARDGTVKKWNCGSGECVSTINLPKGIPKCIKLDKEKSLLFVGSDQGYLYAFDVNSNDVVCF